MTVTTHQRPTETTGLRSNELRSKKKSSALGVKRAILYLRVSDPSQVHTDYDPEGQSILAQRKACQQRAEQLGLAVVDEYVEPGKSARNMDKRPAFQDMMTRIREEKDVDVVIVYELSRMHRNRFDDAIVMMELQKYRIALVSVREPIDDTIEGQMMHGIIATYNEYRSRKDGADIAYKMKEKIKRGGWNGPAPLGYLNSLDTTSDGYRVKVLIWDPERAEHIIWLFVQYATGEWSLRRLAKAVTARGLTTRPSPKRPARLISTKLVGEILNNRFYIGEVVYRGEIYPNGRHEPLIDDVTFQKCQDILAAHRQSGERSQKHWHYLTGSLRCARCHEPLVYNVIQGQGGQYEYYTCNSKLTDAGSCDLPYLPVALVEATIEDLWRRDQLPKPVVERIGQDLHGLLDEIAAEHKQEADRLARRVSAIQAERLKWAENAMNGTVPGDIATTKQTELAAQKATAEARLKGLTAMAA